MAVTGQEMPGLRKARAGARRRSSPVVQAAMAVWLGLTGIVSWVQRALALTVFSSLTRRIIVLNLVALAVLVTGILYLNQWRAGLIDARVQSLRVQGQIIAAAVAASAKVSSDVIQVDPERLLSSRLERIRRSMPTPASSFRSILNRSRRCCAI